MIKHCFSLICGHAVVDERTQLLSVFDIIEQINVNAEPSQTVRIPMRFDLVSVLMRGDTNNPEKGMSRISLCKPKGNQDTIREVDIELNDSTFFRSILSFSGIELTGPGLYKFLIELKQGDKDWEEVAEIPFTVFYNPKDKAS